MTMNLDKYGIKVEKRIHGGWIGYQRLIKDKTEKYESVKKFVFAQHPMGYIGKWQYVFKSKNGTISMIKLLDYRRVGQHLYELLISAPDATIEQANTTRFIKREDCIKRVIEILKETKDEKKSGT